MSTHFISGIYGIHNPRHRGTKWSPERKQEAAERRRLAQLFCKRCFRQFPAVEQFNAHDCVETGLVKPVFILP